MSFLLNYSFKNVSEITYWGVRFTPCCVQCDRLKCNQNQWFLCGALEGKAEGQQAEEATSRDKKDLMRPGPEAFWGVTSNSLTEGQTTL